MVNKTSIACFFPNKYVTILSRQNLYKYPTFIRNTLIVCNRATRMSWQLSEASVKEINPTHLVCFNHRFTNYYINAQHVN